MAVIVAAAEAEAAEVVEETTKEKTDVKIKMEKENTMMTLMSNQANAQEIN